MRGPPVSIQRFEASHAAMVVDLILGEDDLLAFAAAVVDPTRTELTSLDMDTLPALAAVGGTFGIESHRSRVSSVSL
jgi:hypothetical protein